MLWYGGVPLSQMSARLPSVQQHISRFISQIDVREFYRLNWPMTLNSQQSFNLPAGGWPYHPPKLDSLFWPVGACSWACGHYLVTESQLEQIRPQAYSGSKWNALPLLMEDGQDNIVQVQMFMLPARPIAQIPGCESLYLLTLVDDRYNWWSLPSFSLSVSTGTTWQQVVSSLSKWLGQTITVDPIPAAYLNPDPVLSGYYQQLPPLLDTVAYSIGMRVIRTLTGSVRVIGTATSRASIATNQFKWQAKVAGGTFALGNAHGNDLFSELPSQVQVSLPDDTGGTWVQTVTLASLGLNEYAGVVGNANVRTFTNSLVADFSGNPVIPNNQAAILALSQQIATDFYRWRSPGLDLSLSGPIPWDGEAHSFMKEWVHSQQEAKIYTRLQRGTDTATSTFASGVLVTKLPYWCVTFNYAIDGQPARACFQGTYQQAISLPGAAYAFQMADQATCLAKCTNVSPPVPPVPASPILVRMLKDAVPTTSVEYISGANAIPQIAGPVPALAEWVDDPTQSTIEAFCLDNLPLRQWDRFWVVLHTSGRWVPTYEVREAPIAVISSTPDVLGRLQGYLVEKNPLTGVWTLVYPVLIQDANNLQNPQLTMGAVYDGADLVGHFKGQQIYSVSCCGSPVPITPPPPPLTGILYWCISYDGKTSSCVGMTTTQLLTILPKLKGLGGPYLTVAACNPTCVNVSPQTPYYFCVNTASVPNVCLYTPLTSINTTIFTITGIFTDPLQCSTGCVPTTVSQYWCITVPGYSAYCFQGTYAQAQSQVAGIPNAVVTGQFGTTNPYTTLVSCNTVCVVNCPPVCAACNPAPFTFQVNLTGFSGGIPGGGSFCPFAPNVTGFTFSIPPDVFGVPGTALNNTHWNMIDGTFLDYTCEFAQRVLNSTVGRVSGSISVNTNGVTLNLEYLAYNGGPRYDAVYYAPLPALWSSPIVLYLTSELPLGTVAPQTITVTPALSQQVAGSCSDFNLGNVLLNNSTDCTWSYVSPGGVIITLTRGMAYWKLTGTTPSGCTFTYQVSIVKAACCGPLPMVLLTGVGIGPAMLTVTSASPCNNCSVTTTSVEAWYCVSTDGESYTCKYGTLAQVSVNAVYVGTQSYVDQKSCTAACTAPAPPPPPVLYGICDTVGPYGPGALPYQYTIQLGGVTDTPNCPGAAALLNGTNTLSYGASGSMAWSTTATLNQSAAPCSAASGSLVQILYASGFFLYIAGTKINSVAGVATGGSCPEITFQVDPTLSAFVNLPATIIAQPIGNCVSTAGYTCQQCCPQGISNTIRLTWTNIAGNTNFPPTGNYTLTFDPVASQSIGLPTWSYTIVNGCNNGSSNQVFQLTCEGSGIGTWMISVDCSGVDSSGVELSATISGIAGSSCNPLFLKFDGNPPDGNWNDGNPYLAIISP